MSVFQEISFTFEGNFAVVNRVKKGARLLKIE